MNPSICKPVINNPKLFKRCTEQQIQGGHTTSIQNLPKPFDGLQWICTEGCHGQDEVSDLSELYYTDIGKFYEITWETGVETVTFTFEPGDDLNNIQLSYVPLLNFCLTFFVC